jgi:DNA-binding protein HU-beta
LPVPDASLSPGRLGATPDIHHGLPSMIKVDIVNEVSKTADITKVKAEVAVDAVFDAMRTSMQRGERIELRGFGVFQVKPRKRGIGRNPRTGKEVRIPPGRTIRFKPGKDLQNIG